MNLLKFYIDGEWVAPRSDATISVTNPASEQVAYRIAAASAADVEDAVKAARRAFRTFSQSTREERLGYLGRMLDGFKKRQEDFAQVISEDMGAPISLARERQATVGAIHLQNYIDILTSYEFEERMGQSVVRREPIGVCALITPWNWPLNQMVLKVAPALAAGCTVVLKPSEEAPRCALILAEVIHEAGVPAGVFNLINGDGPNAGAALSSHNQVDMVSFTGSTRAGVAIARAAAETVKRVSQELGGKSPNIVMPDADIAHAVSQGVLRCLGNSGQSCNAPTRMLVPRAKLDLARKIAKEAAQRFVVGDPAETSTTMGPVVNKAQFEKIQGLLQVGIDEGADLVTGGVGRPAGLQKGFFVQPTIFSNVRNDMRIAREEIFGPVLSIIPYDTVEEAIDIANDTEYGLHSFIQSSDLEKAREVASQLRTGQVSINDAMTDWRLPFGGYKQSGNGREGGVLGLEDFLEVKAIVGYHAA